ncbi:MAG: 1-acyl-sn-glycerol-3-phosphate acyltransferase [candidate division Zixibacteria bacterium]|nr:1-acyl-sn-glycerol-3-phosphate acyltransferase [candidate division Zixibacteria bacterium]
MKFHYRVVRALINLTMKVLRGWEKQGREYIPLKGGVLIASNHIDLYDPFLIGCTSPRELYYLAKIELFKKPLLGWLLKKLNSIPISRGSFDRKGLQRAAEILRSGKALLVFPEGTRSMDGNLKELKLGVAKLALEAKVPIVPAYLDYSRNWIKSFLQRRKIKIKFGSPFDPDSLSQIPENKEGYQRITREIMQRIKALKETL